jgi:hypothetical protein
MNRLCERTGKIEMLTANIQEVSSKQQSKMIFLWICNGKHKKMPANEVKNCYMY